MKLSAILLMVTPVSACARTGSGGIDCAGWRAIPLDEASIDGLTDRDAAAVLAHNLYGRERGCW